MAVDFPNSPVVGDTFLAGGILRKWDGTTWSIVPQTISGPAGSSGVIGVTSPIVNSGTSTSAALSLSTVPVGLGGTGVQTLSSGAFLKGNGTNAISTQAGILASDITAVEQAKIFSGGIYSGGVSTGLPVAIFVQSTQPASGMSDGDLWFW